jgi:hypothetical protein
MLGGKRGRGAAVTFFCALLVLASASVSAAAAPPFCKGRVVRDDARPLARMPAEKPPPEGELPFGPRNLSMYRLNFGAKVVLDGSHLGYRFAAKGGHARMLHLNWDVRTALRKVDRDGRVLETVDELHMRLGEVKGVDLLQFPFGAHPGLYRIDIVFRTLSGPKLASYSEHFRVVPRRVKLRLAINRDAFGAGETAYARVINLGTVPIALRPGFVIDRKENGGWARVLEPPVSEQSIDDFRWTLAGGQASPCVAFPIPADAAPGAYRFVSSALAYGKIRRQTLTGTFEISASAP